MLKAIALNLLLALGSVAATASSHESRDVGQHEARAFTPSPSCPSDQTFNRLKWKCVCRNPDQTIKAGETSCSCPEGEKMVGKAPGTGCITDCGSQARFVPSKGVCVCSKSYLTYNSDKTCSCAPEKKDTGSGCGSCQCTNLPGAVYTDDGCSCPDNTKLNALKTKCVPECGSKAHLNNDETECECNAQPATFSNGVCTCTGPNKVLNAAGTSCVPSCGSEARLNEAETSCECIIRDATFDAVNKVCNCNSFNKPIKSEPLKRCIPHCGSNAYYHPFLDQCKCFAPGAAFHTETGTCHCTDPQKPLLNAAGTKCTPKCGKNARLKSNEDECECSISGATLQSDNTCSCEDATRPIANADKGKCVPDCGKDANLNTEGTSCECKAEGADFDGVDKICICPSTPNKLKLNEAHDECVFDCGSQGKVKQDNTGCECKANGAAWDNTALTCDCGTSADLSHDFSKCSCKLEGAIFTASGQTCACPSEAPTIMSANNANTKCVLDCGTAGGSLNGDGSECECKKPNSHFDTTSLTCECNNNFFPGAKGACVSDCGSEATYKNGECVCSKKGQAYTDDGTSKTCACPTAGDVWTDGSCHVDCGSVAHWDKKTSKCVCDKKGQTFTSGANTCGCDTGFKWNGGACVKDCGDAATYNAKSQLCVCNDKTKIFTEADAPTYGTCACAATHTWNGSKCVLDCGPSASLSGSKCVCDKRGMTWTDKVCACPGGATYDESKRRCPAVVQT
ncbi:hypothetical protein F66182_9553 [Fusarium sp. NRRL 66182]|nr:hypothetical protein F66182_9553 [Fusarium sp. NRRL 66182]